MRLWTIQPAAVYQQIQDMGLFRCNPDRCWWMEPDEDPVFEKSMLRMFGDSYDWLVRQMEKRIGPRPDGVRYPVWAWYQFAWKKKPDLRKERWSNGSPGEKQACIFLDVPDDLVLLSDFGNWHHVLNGWPILDTEEESERYDAWEESVTEAEKRVFLDTNWERIFETEPFDNGYTSRGADIQATFWELKKEHVRGVRFFTVGIRKTDKTR